MLHPSKEGFGEYLERAWAFKSRETPNPKWAECKRVSDSRVYRVASAKFVAHVGSQTDNTRDHEFWNGDLYMTLKGRWFVVGDGGPSSIFSTSIGNASIGQNSAIVVLESYEAIKMLEDCGKFDAILGCCMVEEA